MKNLYNRFKEYWSTAKESDKESYKIFGFILLMIALLFPSFYLLHIATGWVFIPTLISLIVLYVIMIGLLGGGIEEMKAHMKKEKEGKSDE